MAPGTNFSAIPLNAGTISAINIRTPCNITVTPTPKYTECVNKYVKKLPVYPNTSAGTNPCELTIPNRMRYTNAIEIEPVIDTSLRKPNDAGSFRSSQLFDLSPTNPATNPAITDSVVVGWAIVKSSLPVTALTNGRIKLGAITIYKPVNTAAKPINLPPVKPASTPAAINTNGNQYNIWPVKNTDFHFVKRATKILNAKPISITTPICVPYSAPISTEAGAAALPGIKVLNVAIIPSIDFPVIKPVPVFSTKKPIAVIRVPLTISDGFFFCKIKPTIATRARKIAPCPKISLIIKFKTDIFSISFHLNFIAENSCNLKFYLRLLYYS